ncbi:MAG: hypothetical protein ABW022_09705 [Actinoplanes sp.]
MLVPTGILFTRVWQENSNQRDRTELEQQGVEYLTALSPLISALAEAQSTALQGVSEPPDSLATAVAGVAAADARLGEELQTTPRWTGLQTKINNLSKATGPLAVYQAHVEATDLTLALYAAVRRNSELNRDPNNAVSNLQQAVAIDMPTTIVRVSRMGDLANILQAVTGADRVTIGTQFGYEVLAVQDLVDSLTENLQAAVDNTDSAALSGGLVSTLDSFRRGVESMVRGANPGGNPQAATISTAQSTLQTALSSLSGVTLTEMKRLLDDRKSTLDYRRIEALILVVVVVVLVLLAVLWPVLQRRRNPEPAAPATPSGDPNRDVALNRPPGGYGNNPYDQAPGYGEVNPTRRERSGALR